MYVISSLWEDELVVLHSFVVVGMPHVLFGFLPVIVNLPCRFMNKLAHHIIIPYSVFI